MRGRTEGLSPSHTDGDEASSVEEGAEGTRTGTLTLPPFEDDGETDAGKATEVDASSRQREPGPTDDLFPPGLEGGSPRARRRTARTRRRTVMLSIGSAATRAGTKDTSR